MNRTIEQRSVCGSHGLPWGVCLPCLDAANVPNLSERALERRTSVIALYCTTRPPRVYVLEDGEGLEAWVSMHRKSEMRWAAPRAIVLAANLLTEDMR